HRDAVHQLLNWHFEATGSAKAGALLEGWDEVQHQIAWVMPKALLQYQDQDAILAARARKELVDELATALSMHQIMELKRAYKKGRPVLHGAMPAYGEMDTEGMFRLLNAYTVLEMAQVVADKRLGAAPQPAKDKAVKNLILTEDFALMTALAKHARQAVADYSDQELAALVAHKRLSDFKQALSMRNILSMDSPGTYAWILHQSAKNRAALGEIPSFDELFSQTALPDLLARSAAE
ncbi:MAG: glutamate synthase large subunit, partial [Pseudomonadota bacterium]